MEGIIGLVFLFFIINTVGKLFKKAVNKATTAQTQQPAQETAKPQPKKPVTKREDFRFPSQIKREPLSTPLEGRDPKAELSTYTPIAPSMDLGSQFSNYQSTVAPSADLQNQFSDYQGSMAASAAEGAGYHAEAYDAVSVPYRTDSKTPIHVLPHAFTRDALVQAVVMSEILKRPRALR